MGAKDMSGETDSAPDPKESGVTRVPSASVRPGQMLLGRYRVERVLGQGGMGTVVAARHVELDQLFAFKFLHGEVVARPEVIERFVREARAAAKLENEHVAKVHDVGRLESGEPYMLMEHLTGRDLDRVLEEDGPLPLGDVLRHVLAACEAVAEAHARGIIHRDLKPSNLFLHKLRSGRELLKVLDFGISRELSAQSARLTSTHAMIGSPLYMSPEQVLQPKLVDARSDVWALGVVLYELATGQPPFLADGVPEVIGKILQEKPEPPSEKRPGLPAWFDSLVLRCLEKAVHERFQSVTELADAIGRHELRRVAADDPQATVEKVVELTPNLELTPAPAVMPVPRATPTPEEPPTSATTPSSPSARPPRLRRRFIVTAFALLGAALAIAALLSARSTEPTLASSTASPIAEPAPARGDGTSTSPLAVEPGPTSVAGSGPPVAIAENAAPETSVPDTPASARAGRRSNAPTPRAFSARPSTQPLAPHHDPLDIID